MDTITEIIPDDLPEWAKKAMDEGQFFNVVSEKIKEADFYRDFYEKNRIPVLQYESLREHFNNMIKNVMGNDYYNMGMDVYECDRICCEDITYKANRTILERLFN